MICGWVGRLAKSNLNFLSVQVKQRRVFVISVYAFFNKKKIFKRTEQKRFAKDICKRNEQKKLSWQQRRCVSDHSLCHRLLQSHRPSPLWDPGSFAKFLTNLICTNQQPPYMKAISFKPRVTQIFKTHLLNCLAKGWFCCDMLHITVAIIIWHFNHKHTFDGGSITQSQTCHILQIEILSSKFSKFYQFLKLIGGTMPRA